MANIQIQLLASYVTTFGTGWGGELNFKLIMEEVRKGCSCMELISPPVSHLKVANTGKLTRTILWLLERARMALFHLSYGVKIAPHLLLIV